MNMNVMISVNYYDDLNDMENIYIEKYNTLCPNGYNSTRGGMHGCS